MSRMIAIRKVALDERHLRPGRTKHASNGKEFSPFTKLAICQYPGEVGIYLMHVCENGQVADTWHENPEDAIYQAQWEFGVQPDEWIEANEPF